jgi:hypothetical protein
MQLPPERFPRHEWDFTPFVFYGASRVHYYQAAFDFKPTPQFKNRWLSPGLFAAVSDTFEIRDILFPHWFAVLITAAPPIILALRTGLRPRKSSIGRCSVCGYDLRATPDRCPECGKVTK